MMRVFFNRHGEILGSIVNAGSKSQCHLSVSSLVFVTFTWRKFNSTRVSDPS